jgi:7-cyano-7-deazaguanine reductase
MYWRPARSECGRIPCEALAHSGALRHSAGWSTGTLASVERGELTVLGATVRHPIEHVELFPAPAHVTEVRFSTEELASVCPITGQPDISAVEIIYAPGEWCVESKSLKLYLWGFRDRPMFAEALAAEIAREIYETAQARSVTVTLTQRPRGGITVSATAVRHAT